MGSVQGLTTRSAGKIDMHAVRALIAGYLQIDVRHVTDNAHLSHDLGADGLDRLELLIRLEDLTGNTWVGEKGVGRAHPQASSAIGR